MLTYNAGECKKVKKKKKCFSCDFLVCFVDFYFVLITKFMFQRAMCILREIYVSIFELGGNEKNEEKNEKIKRHNSQFVA